MNLSILECKDHAHILAKDIPKSYESLHIGMKNSFFAIYIETHNSPVKSQAFE